MGIRYFAKYRVTDKLSKYEKEKIKRLRKISILEKLPFSQWSKWELVDLIEEYNMFYLLCCKLYKNETPLSIPEFVYSGKYEAVSLFEELKINE